jgi:hypothetical protein
VGVEAVEAEAVLGLEFEFEFERVVVNGGDGRAVIGRAQRVSVNSIRSNEREN